jgi:O-antigen/teichoic acid export membrane protein
MALGQPQYLLRLAGIHVAVLLPLLFFLVPKLGSVGAAWSFFGAAVVSLPVQLRIALRMLDASVTDIVSGLWRPVVAVGAMYLGVDFILSIAGSAGSTSNPAWLLILAVSAGVVIYTAVVFVGWYFTGRPPGPESRLVANIHRLLSQRKSSQNGT